MEVERGELSELAGGSGSTLGSSAGVRGATEGVVGGTSTLGTGGTSGEAVTGGEGLEELDTLATGVTAGTGADRRNRVVISSIAWCVDVSTWMISLFFRKALLCKIAEILSSALRR